ncbi:MAG: phosphoglycerate dehydrogenase [bacterium]
MKVLVSDKLSPKGVKVFEETEGIQVDVKTGMTPEELIACIPEYDALVVRSATKVTPQVIEAAKNLKVIGRAGSGVDNIDLPAATKHGIVVMNTPGGNTITTAEHAVSMLLALCRHIPQADASMKQKKWEKKKFMGTEYFGKTLGVLGLGKIGTEVAKRARGLMMKVIAYDPFISADAAQRLEVELVGMEDLFRRADFITVHTPKSPETMNLINAKTIALMKDGVKIVNCARGGIVNEQDLADAVKKGKVSGAALDVFSQEPPAEDNPLLGLPQVIMTPHLGASTEEAQDKVAVDIAYQIVDMLKNSTVCNAVNAPCVAKEVLANIKPYITLAERMGSIACQIAEGRMNEFLVSYSGEVLNNDLAPITMAAIKGLLSPILHEEVNDVNAMLVAKDRGIKVDEIKESVTGAYSSLVSITLVTDKGKASIAGTLFNRIEPRIVEMNGFDIEIVPAENMLVFSNIDKPGLIGSIGMTLGEYHVNIAGMQFGRAKPGGDAVSVLSVDSRVSEELLTVLGKLPNVVSVKSVRL